MQRRTLLKRIGAVGAATTGVAGTAAAAPASRIPLDRKLDVSHVSGRVELDDLVEEDVATLLDAEDVAGIAGVADPADLELVVAEGTEQLDLSTEYCCPTCGGPCGCECCFITVC